MNPLFKPSMIGMALGSPTEMCLLRLNADKMPMSSMQANDSHSSRHCEASTPRFILPDLDQEYLTGRSWIDFGRKVEKQFLRLEHAQDMLQHKSIASDFLVSYI